MSAEHRQPEDATAREARFGLPPSDEADSHQFIGQIIGQTQATLLATVLLVSLLTLFVWFLVPPDLQLAIELTGVSSVGLVAWFIFDRLRHGVLRLQQGSERRLKAAETAAALDPLTGLHNRRMFYERLQSDLESARHDRTPMSVLILDLDDLKITNDRHGHQVGDIVLAQLSTVLRVVARPEDMVARIGGDEFGIILPRTDRRGADAVSARIWKELTRNPVIISDQLSLSVTISIGVAIFPGNGETVESLVYWADAALYSNKLARKGITLAKHAVVDEQQVTSSVVQALTAALNVRDMPLHNHSRRVAQLTGAIAKQMDVPETEIWVMQQGAFLHDIGKIALSDRLLTKAERLTTSEWKEIREHPELGHRILKGIPSLERVAAIVYAHHERYDGRGYPQGLTGEDIPLGARIFAVADAYDAMTNRRPYQPVLTREAAMGEIALHAGTQFDPLAVSAFLQIMGGLDPDVAHQELLSSVLI